MGLDVTLHATPRVQRVIEAAESIAKELGHEYLGTEHVLLGLIDTAGGVATAALSNYVELGQLKSKVMEIIQGAEYQTESQLPES